MTGLLVQNAHWVTAGPLWKQTAGTPDVLRRPTILGFGSDNFMDELIAQLAKAPDGIAARVQTGPSPSYRERQPGEAFDFQPMASQLKLYQPVHGWFYLVAGSLVCQLPGLPDHKIDVANGETTGFVLRRQSQNGELALVTGEGGKKSWQPVTDGTRLAPGEEVLPTFPLAFQEADRRRRMVAGVIPVGSQDGLQVAPIGSPPAAGGKPGPADALEDVKGRVTHAIRLLHDQSPAPPDEQATETSRFILMDLADFVSQFIPVAWKEIQQDAPPSPEAAGDLVRFMRTHGVLGQSWASLVKNILTTPLSTPFGVNLRFTDTSQLGDFDTRLQAALEEATSTQIATIPVVQQQPTATLYTARMVYQRPHCVPFFPEVLSAPTEPFALASYFDPDAPGRPIRIALPFDPSIKGLRQFRKNVTLVMSDALRKKVKAIGKVDSIEGPGFDCGGISLSIPIITICAMIILFIFLNLLNIVFWWLPFVKICFPKIKVEP